MKKLFIPFAATIFMLIIVRAAAPNINSTIQNFFGNYGIILSSKPINTETVTLPDIMSDVYENYNKIQKQAGLDLTPYLGKTVKKYTYLVTNFPFETDEMVFANILVFKGRIIAADVMTNSISGFMFSPADPIFYMSKKEK